ncbi:MAG: hypothetical protein ABIG34_03990 [Candidatus Peregrinibacteria bacterium]
MGSIKLLGIVHADPDAERRVERALSREQPDVITVELHPSEEKKLNADWLAPEIDERIDRITAQLNSDAQQLLQLFTRTQGKEFYTAIRFAKRRDLPYFLIDTRRTEQAQYIARTLLDQRDEDIIHAIEETSLELQREKIRNMFALIALLHASNDMDAETTLLDQCRFITQEGRDAVPARALNLLSAMYRGKILHVCGAAHTLNDTKGESLYSRLRRGGPANVSRGLAIDL